MSVNYRSIAPVSQQEGYSQNESVEFVLNLEGEKLVPGTVELEGLAGIFSDARTFAPVQGSEEICYDPVTGMHSLIRDITTEFEKLGIAENLQHYPRLVKEARLCSENLNSLGTETKNSVEGCVPGVSVACGMSEGDHRHSIPFSIKLQNIVNKASAPLSSSSTGEIRLRLRLAANDEFLFGADYDNTTAGYLVGNLRLRYQTVPDDGKKEQVTLEQYSSYTVNLDTNNQNISAFVPGLCDSVHMSFIKNANRTNSQKNYLACEVPPGLPPLGSNATETPKEYGLERVYYAVNDVDTALVGFTMESREELLMNGIRSFGGQAENYSTLQRKMRDPEYQDGYVLGIPFGSPIQLANNKFAAELQSQCSNANQYTAILHFRCLQTVQA